MENWGYGGRHHVASCCAMLHHMSKMERIPVSMPAELVERIDRALPEGVSRAFWIRRAVERALEDKASRSDAPDTSSLAPHAGASMPPAPAEQPEVYGVRLKSSAEQPGKPPLKSGRELLSRADDFRRASFRRQPGPNVENVRSSEQAKRDVSPRPKGKS